MKEMFLPNGDEIYYLDKFTAEYVYNEIFNDHVYLQHGISIKEGDVIFDVGANMGIFSLYASKLAKQLQIYTFEPIPAIFEVLEANLSKISHLHFVKNYNIGLSNVKGIAKINFLPHSSGDSSIIPVDLNFKVKKIVEHYQEIVVKETPAAKWIPKFLRKTVVRLGLKRYYNKGLIIPCQLCTLSEIIAENDIETIHLLKIDAENHENQVLKGIADEDWDKIQQIAMEVHTHIPGGTNLYQELTELLTQKEFACFEGEESLETLWGVYMLYARRSS